LDGNRLAAFVGGVFARYQIQIPIDPLERANELRAMYGDSLTTRTDDCLVDLKLDSEPVSEIATRLSKAANVEIVCHPKLISNSEGAGVPSIELKHLIALRSILGAALK
jgi:hypothetical protein